MSGSYQYVYVTKIKESHVKIKINILWEKYKMFLFAYDICCLIKIVKKFYKIR